MNLFNETIRPELREEAFRRFEPVVQSAVLSWPVPIKLDWTETGQKFNTILSRVRDAFVSFRRYKWPTTWFIPATHQAAIDGIKCYVDPHDSRLIICGPAKRTLQSLPLNISAPTSQSEPLPLELVTSTDFGILSQLVTCYSLLASNRVPHLPKLFIKRVQDGVPDQQINDLLEALQSSYDIAVQTEITHWIVS